MDRKPRAEKPKQEAESKVVESKIKDEPVAGKHEPPASVQPVEPEDARHMGSGKPMQREMLERNVRPEGGAAQEHPETVAGQHATGSFTDKKRRAG